MRKSAALLLVLGPVSGGCAPAPPPAPSPATVVVAPPAESAMRPSAVSCDEGRYEPAPPSTAASAKLPPLPAIPDVPPRNGDIFTVRGAVHAFRTPGELAALAPADAVIEGVIVDENITRAPRCALHAAGKRDPKGCAPEIPAFWLADDTSAGAPRIRVLGFASSFSQVYEAQRLARGAPASGKPSQRWQDERWGTEVPWPMPRNGQRVRVRGTYAQGFERASGAPVEDQLNGILSYKQIDYL